MKKNVTVKIRDEAAIVTLHRGDDEFDVFIKFHDDTIEVEAQAVHCSHDTSYVIGEITYSELESANEQN